MSVILIIIGAAGIAGNIEQSKSLIIPILITAAGLILAFKDIREEGKREESSSHSNNDASDPAALKNTRRRA